MTKEEFDLSEKRFVTSESEVVYPTEDVKEFIELGLEDFKELTHNFNEKKLVEIIRRFKKRAGKELVE